MVDDVPCASCMGARLRDDSAAVRFRDFTLDQVSQWPLGRAYRVLQGAEAQRRRAAHRGRPDPGDPRPAQVPGRRRARLPVARARDADALRRRKPAHPAGEPDRQRADRRALRARRADDRPPPARQRPVARGAAAPPRPGQHARPGRARPRGDRGGRPPGRFRPRLGRWRRRGHRERPAVEGQGEQEVAHRPVPERQAGDPGADQPPARPTARRLVIRGRGTTTSRTSTSRSRSAW